MVRDEDCTDVKYSTASRSNNSVSPSQRHIYKVSPGNLWVVIVDSGLSRYLTGLTLHKSGHPLDSNK